MVERELILVTGATGRQGGAVVRHLLARGMPIRALTRNPDSARARSLAATGVELVQGDMDDVESLERAMIGAHGVYSVQDFWSVGAEREVQQGRNVADAARGTGVEHLVFSSVGGAERGSRIDHFETKGVIERHIRALGLPATIFRPASFMENYYIPAVEKGLLKGRLVDPVRADIPYQTIATDDIGKFVALAFARPEEFLGTELEIAGSELTNRHAAEVFARVMGRPVKYRRLPMPIVRVALGKEFYQMFRWFNAGGYQADVAGLRRRYPELQLRTLEDWLREEGWENKRTISVKRDRIGRPLGVSGR
ncbi:NmrA/HSCARG family protein [Nocardia sp. CA-129566]|uniref:NmrA/HSCARG family protein n=1 Tax=Nocardia sp. CA-129566 TaxID=3239976 RepID=UPI003D97AF23